MQADQMDAKIIAEFRLGRSLSEVAHTLGQSENRIDNFRKILARKFRRRGVAADEIFKRTGLSSSEVDMVIQEKEERMRQFDQRKA